jgi:hypothetical protein
MHAAPCLLNNHNDTDDADNDVDTDGPDGKDVDTPALTTGE